MATQDISRSAFDPRKHYTGVRMQQGRVITDDDWNENERIASEDKRRSRVHIIGPTGSPDEGFRIADPRSEDGLIEFDILPGTFYLGGMRLEMEETQTYRTQTDWLQGPADQPAVPDDERFDLVFLMAYQEPVTAVEDSELFEVALGGPDTSTRMRTVQRVFLLEDVETADCAEAWQVLEKEWKENNMGTLNEENELVPDVRLTVTFDSEGDPGDLCTPSVAGGYLGAENQVIRVQLVDQNHLTWGFDNGAPLYRVEAAGDRRTLTMLTGPKDQAHWPQAGQIVEILPWSAALPNGDKLAENYGHLSRVETSYDPTTSQLSLAIGTPSDDIRFDDWRSRSDALALEGSGEYYFMRIWDRGSDRESEPKIPFTPGTPVTLGHTGLQVTISGPHRIKGDYWIIAARPETPDHVVPWDLESGRRPHGVRQFFAPLALLHWHRTERWLGKIRMGEVLESWQVSVSPDGTTLTFELLTVSGTARENSFRNLFTNLVYILAGEVDGRISSVSSTIVVELDQACSLSDLFSELFEETTILEELAAQVTDCRPTFPPLTAITADDVSFADSGVCRPDMGNVETVQEALEVLCQRPSGGHDPYLVLRYVGGDGQEGPPDDMLPCTLAVGVENELGQPQADVTVTFTADEQSYLRENTENTETDVSTTNEISVYTNDDGIAEVRWIPGRDAEPGCHRVVARLEDPPQDTALEVHFKATVREAGEAPETETWPQVTDISWDNDQPLSLSEFNQQGLTVTFSKEMDSLTASPDTFIVTLELPTLEPPALEQIYSEDGPEKLYERNYYPGHRVFIVPGDVSPDGTSWTFKPNPVIPESVLTNWLLLREPEFFHSVGDYEPQIRCRVVLKGNAILNASGDCPLDGNVFGRHKQGGDGDYIGLDLPSSGDGVKGGDFESWFYLVPDEEPGEPSGQPGGLPEPLPKHPDWPSRDPPNDEIKGVLAKVSEEGGGTDESTVEYHFFVLIHWVRDLVRQGYKVPFTSVQADEIKQTLQSGDKSKAAELVDAAYQDLKSLKDGSPT